MIFLQKQLRSIAGTVSDLDDLATVRDIAIFQHRIQRCSALRTHSPKPQYVYPNYLMSYLQLQYE